MKEPWFVDGSGVIYDFGMKPFGFFDRQGEVFDQDNIDVFGSPKGNPIGLVDIVGDTYDHRYQLLGMVDAGGAIYNPSKHLIASVTPLGFVLNNFGQRIGNVDKCLHDETSKKAWRLMIYRAAAAVVLLIPTLRREIH